MDSSVALTKTLRKKLGSLIGDDSQLILAHVKMRITTMIGPLSQAEPWTIGISFSQLKTMGSTSDALEIVAIIGW